MAKRKQIAGPELREFIERIRRAYATSNMSFEALAERARGSVDPATIQRLLKGNLDERMPSADPGGESTIPSTCGGEAQNGVCAWHVN